MLRPNLGAEEVWSVLASTWSLVSAVPGAASEFSSEVSPAGDGFWSSTVTSVPTVAADKVIGLWAEDQLLLL
uniref:Uncharacterized protein n=1 Tax=Arundo donax TaxID=35708 RepID=A0A0A9FAR3_ARUDO